MIFITSQLFDYYYFKVNQWNSNIGPQFISSNICHQVGDTNTDVQLAIKTNRDLRISDCHSDICLLYTSDAADE